MKHPYAIALDVGTSLAQPYRLLAHPAAGLCRPLCRRATHACPAGEDIQGWLDHAEAGDYEDAWRALDRKQSAARRHGPRLLSPLRNRVQPRSA